MEISQETREENNLIEDIRLLDEVDEINEEEYKILVNKKIKVKKRKIQLLKEANYYSEEVRRIITKKYGFNKLYEGGLSIRTPLDPKYQIEILEALREGLESYDRRHGWRGVITNKKNDNNWIKKTDEYKIDRSLNWKIAKVLNVEDLLVKIETEDKEMGFIKFNNVHWIRKENFKEILIQDIFIFINDFSK